MSAKQCEGDERNGLHQTRQAEHEGVSRDPVELIADHDFLDQDRERQEKRRTDVAPEFGKAECEVGIAARRVTLS